MLETLSLACQRGDRRLFSRVSFQVSPGDLLWLQGRNGAGKTSLLRLLSGLAQPLEGEIHWQGQDIRRQGEAYRGALCYLGHHNAIKEDLSPLENLLVWARLEGYHPDQDSLLDALEQVGLLGREDLACRDLSQGQKRRVALARLLLSRKPLWLLDEPFVALDTAAVQFVAGLIGAHLQRGGLAIMTTHQPVDIPAGRQLNYVLQAA